MKIIDKALVLVVFLFITKQAFAQNSINQTTAGECAAYTGLAAQMNSGPGNEKVASTYKNFEQKFRQIRDQKSYHIFDMYNKQVMDQSINMQRFARDAKNPSLYSEWVSSGAVKCISVLTKANQK